MHTKDGPKGDPTKGYETTDFSLGVITKAFIWMGVCIAFFYAVTWVFSWAIGFPGRGIYAGTQAEIPKPPPEAYQSRQIPEAPNPLLQDNVTATSDMRNLRIQEKRRLAGGTDEITGKPTISIDEAMGQEAARRGN